MWSITPVTASLPYFIKWQIIFDSIVKSTQFAKNSKRRVKIDTKVYVSICKVVRPIKIPFNLLVVPSNKSIVEINRYIVTLNRSLVQPIVHSDWQIDSVANTDGDITV